MDPVLIIGYGNMLRGDDALGWHAAQRLSEQVADERVIVKVCHQLTPELAEWVSQARAVAFLDARVDGQPGEIRAAAVEPDLSASGLLTHHLTPGGLLALTQTLYGTCPTAVVFSLTGERYALGSTLSPRVEATLPALVACVRRWIEGQLG